MVRSCRLQIERTPKGETVIPSSQKLVRDANLAPGGLFDGERHDGGLDLWRHTVLQDRLTPRNLLQGEFAAFVVKLLKAVEAIAQIAEHLAGLAHIAKLPGKLQQANLGFDNLLFLGV